MNRRSDLFTMMGGLTYAAINLAIDTAFPDHWAGSPDRLLGWGYADWSRLLWIPSALLLVGFTGIYHRLQPHLGRLGTAGFRISAAGLTLEILGLVIEFWIFGLLLVPWTGEFNTGSPGSNFGYTVNGIGTLLLMIGLLLFAPGVQRTGAPPFWRVWSILIALSTLSAFYFFFADLMEIHALLHGLLWIAAGLAPGNDEQEFEGGSA